MSIPPGLAAMINTGPPVEPRPSASVLLVRPGSPWEVLMMRRPGGADFAPGAYVFPGGSVQEDDRSFPDSFQAAAVRELFEEVGVLLAHRAASFATDVECKALRQELARGASFAAGLTGLGLEPAFEELTLFARWITPLQLRRRFDTCFYLARTPEGQQIHPQPGEVEDWLWIAPQVALSEGRLTLVHATRQVLAGVAGQAELDKLINGFRDRPVETVRPVLRQLTDGTWELVNPA